MVLRHILSPSHLPFLSLIPHSNLMCGTILFAYLGSVERSFSLHSHDTKWVWMGKKENQTPDLYLATSASWVTSFHSALDFFFLLSLFFYIAHKNSSFPLLCLSLSSRKPHTKVTYTISFYVLLFTSHRHAL